MELTKKIQVKELNEGSVVSMVPESCTRVLLNHATITKGRQPPDMFFMAVIVRDFELRVRGGIPEKRLQLREILVGGEKSEFYLDAFVYGGHAEALKELNAEGHRGVWLVTTEPRVCPRLIEDSNWCPLALYMGGKYSPKCSVWFYVKDLESLYSSQDAMVSSKATSSNEIVTINRLVIDPGQPVTVCGVVSSMVMCDKRKHNQDQPGWKVVDPSSRQIDTCYKYLVVKGELHLKWGDILLLRNIQVQCDRGTLSVYVENTDDYVKFSSDLSEPILPDAIHMNYIVTNNVEAKVRELRQWWGLSGEKEQSYFTHPKAQSTSTKPKRQVIDISNIKRDMVFGLRCQVVKCQYVPSLLSVVLTVQDGTRSSLPILKYNSDLVAAQDTTSQSSSISEVGSVQVDILIAAPTIKLQSLKSGDFWYISKVECKSAEGRHRSGTGPDWVELHINPAACTMYQIPTHHQFAKEIKDRLESPRENVKTTNEGKENCGSDLNTKVRSKAASERERGTGTLDEVERGKLISQKRIQVENIYEKLVKSKSVPQKIKDPVHDEPGTSKFIPQIDSGPESSDTTINTAAKKKFGRELLKLKRKTPKKQNLEESVHLESTQSDSSDKSVRTEHMEVEISQTDLATEKTLRTDPTQLERSQTKSAGMRTESKLQERPRTVSATTLLAGQEKNMEENRTEMLVITDQEQNTELELVPEKKGKILKTTEQAEKNDESVESTAMNQAQESTTAIDHNKAMECTAIIQAKPTESVAKSRNLATINSKAGSNKPVMKDSVSVGLLGIDDLMTELARRNTEHESEPVTNHKNLVTELEKRNIELDESKTERNNETSTARDLLLTLERVNSELKEPETQINNNSAASNSTLTTEPTPKLTPEAEAESVITAAVETERHPSNHLENRQHATILESRRLTKILVKCESRRLEWFVREAAVGVVYRVEAQVVNLYGVPLSICHICASVKCIHMWVSGVCKTCRHIDSAVQLFDKFTSKTLLKSDKLPCHNSNHTGTVGARVSQPCSVKPMYRVKMVLADPHTKHSAAFNLAKKNATIFFGVQPSFSWLLGGRNDRVGNIVAALLHLSHQSFAVVKRQNQLGDIQLEIVFTAVEL